MVAISSNQRFEGVENKKITWLYQRIKLSKGVGWWQIFNIACGFMEVLWMKTTLKTVMGGLYIV